MDRLDPIRLATAKWAYSTRRVDPSDCVRLSGPDARPEAGDLVLAKVSAIGSHANVECPTGRKSALLPGDEVVLAYGNRYAPDQYEAFVPDDLDPCHMVAAGGLAARATSWHERLRGPTEIEPAGLLCRDDGEPVNLADFAMAQPSADMPPLILAVFGTSMNSGKTITAASLVRGLSQAGYRCGAVKITGTAAGGDPWLMRDYGARHVLDFTDAGLASTFGERTDTLVGNSLTLLRGLGAAECDAAVIEIADGLFQAETAALAEHSLLRRLFDGVFFAAQDALGAVAGVRRLIDTGHTVLGVSGAVMRSPLAAREARAALDIPLFHIRDLQGASAIAGMLERLNGRCRAAAE